MDESNSELTESKDGAFGCSVKVNKEEQSGTSFGEGWWVNKMKDLNLSHCVDNSPAAEDLNHQTNASKAVNPKETKTQRRRRQKKAKVKKTSFYR